MLCVLCWLQWSEGQEGSDEHKKTLGLQNNTKFQTVQETRSSEGKL